MLRNYWRHLPMRRRWSCVICALAVILLNVSAARPDLIHLWSFDETDGNIAYDSVGSLDGILMGKAQFVPDGGISGGALAVSAGTNDFVTMGDVLPLNSGSFSIQAWIQIPDGSTDGMIAVGKHHSGGGNGYFLAVNDVRDGAIPDPVNHAHFYDSGPTSGTSLTIVNDGNWHQLVGVYDAESGMASIYVDGALENSAAIRSIATNDAEFMIGGIPDFMGGLLWGFTGLIDEVQVYDNALSDDDVQFLFQNP